MKSRIGYFLDYPVVGPGKLSRQYYSHDNKPHLLNNYPCYQDTVYTQTGGNPTIFGSCLQKLVTFLLPFNKSQLAAVIGLLVMNNFKISSKKQAGGSYLNNMERVLMGMSKNVLVVVGGLLLLDYFTGKKKQSGGGCGCGIKLNKILEYDETIQSGGSNQISSIISGIVGSKNFIATGLLLLLHNWFKKGKKHTMSGGGNFIDVIRNLIIPMKLDMFMVTLGLIALTKFVTKRHRKTQKGGNGERIEVVGDKPLNYTKDLKQFGCKIPEWGSDLGKCI